MSDKQKVTFMIYPIQMYRVKGSNISNQAGSLNVISFACAKASMFCLV